MRIRILFLVSTLLLSTLWAGAQITRIGSCKANDKYDHNYLTPYVFGGKIYYDIPTSPKSSEWTYGGGLTWLYNFSPLRLGAGVRYQFLSQTFFGQDVVKPYLAMEWPLSFGDFMDFGLYANLGPSLPLGDGDNKTGLFAEGGVFFNFVITSNSGIFLGADYGYNQFEGDFGMADNTIHYREAKILLGYRFWF